MKKTLFMGIVVSMICNLTFAQFQMNTAGKVSIGSNATTAYSSLNINTNGNSSYSLCVAPTAANYYGIYYTNAFGGGGYGIYSYLVNSGDVSIMRAIYSVAYNSTPQTQGQAQAITGVAGNAYNGYNNGIYGILQGSNFGAAVYGQTVTAGYVAPDAMYAGYFSGNVHITGNIWAAGGTINGSDERLKKDILPLESSDNLFKLCPKEYKLKSKKELLNLIHVNKNVSDTAKAIDNNYPDPDYIKKEHYGFLAQDLQKVYPDLVYTTGGDSILGIDYIGLIPIIIDQLQKMKKEMTYKDSRIDSLEKKLNNCCSLSSLKSAKTDVEIEYLGGQSDVPMLEQNAPNPFSITTTVNFYIPQSAKTVAIYIYDLQGTQKKSFIISSRGKSSIVINGAELLPGMYLYTLVVDGNEINTLKMVLTD
jgi:hypothetical protein